MLNKYYSIALTMLAMSLNNNVLADSNINSAASTVDNVTSTTSSALNQIDDNSMGSSTGSIASSNKTMNQIQNIVDTKVEPALSSVLSSDLYQNISDEINNMFKSDPDLSNVTVNIEKDPNTNEVNVTLQGDVNNDSLYEKAVMYAESVKNVLNVYADNLKILTPEKNVSDLFLIAKIKGKILQEKLLGSYTDDSFTNLKVDALNGTVTLSGQVSNSDLENSLVSFVKSIDGVTSVNSELTVDNSQ